MKASKILELIEKYPDSDMAIAFKLGQESLKEYNKDNVVIINSPPHCHRGHDYHTYVPWMYNKPYDKVCNICGFEAASVFNDFPLCDCCAQDWSVFCNKQRDDGIEVNKGNWNTLYQLFRDKMLDKIPVLKG